MQNEGLYPRFQLAEIWGIKKHQSVLCGLVSECSESHRDVIDEPFEVQKAQDKHHDEILNIRKLNRTGLTEVTLGPKSPIVGKRVKELRLGDDTLMVSVRRKGKLRIVRGETILHANDKVTIFSEKPKADFLENYLNGTLDDSELPEESLVCNREVEIPPESSIDGKRIRDLSLPEDCVLVKIIRNRQIILPRGDTVLYSGDIVEIFGVDEKLLEAESNLVS